MAGELKLHCPFCGNTDADMLSLRKRPSRLAYIFLFIGLPFMFKKENVHCFNCHKDFMPPEGYNQAEDD